MMEVGLIVLTAFISLFLADRKAVRKLLPHGGFLEMYCSAPPAACEARDVKGLYKRGRAGKIKNHTGIDLPYETPENSEFVVATDRLSIKASVDQAKQAIMPINYKSNREISKFPTVPTMRPDCLMRLNSRFPDNRNEPM